MIREDEKERVLQKVDAIMEKVELPQWFTSRAPDEITLGRIMNADDPHKSLKEYREEQEEYYSQEFTDRHLEAMEDVMSHFSDALQKDEWISAIEDHIWEKYFKDYDEVNFSEAKEFNNPDVCLQIMIDVGDDYKGDTEIEKRGWANGEYYALRWLAEQAGELKEFDKAAEHMAEVQLSRGFYVDEPPEVYQEDIDSIRNEVESPSLKRAVMLLENSFAGYASLEDLEIPIVLDEDFKLTFAVKTDFNSAVQMMEIAKEKEQFPKSKLTLECENGLYAAICNTSPERLGSIGYQDGKIPIEQEIKIPVKYVDKVIYDDGFKRNEAYSPVLPYKPELEKRDDADRELVESDFRKSKVTIKAKELHREKSAKGMGR